MAGDAAGRGWRDPIIVLAAMLVTAIPLLGPQIPPLADLPGHMGRLAIELGQGDPFIAAHYGLNLRLMSNLAFDLLTPPLAALFGVEVAVKLLVIATAAGLAGAMLWAAREAHGRIPPAAGFALPFVFAFPFQFGFVNYWLALALAFAGLALWLRLGPRRWRGSLFALYAFGTWLAHPMSWGILGILIFSAEIARRRREGAGWAAGTGGAIVSCLPMALPLIVMAAGVAGSEAGAAPTYFVDFTSKFSFMAMALSDRHQNFDLVSVAIAIGVIALAIVTRAVRFEPVFGLAALLLLAIFLAMPFMLIGASYADMRLAPPMIATALLAIDARGRLGLALAIAGTLFFGVRTAATTRSFALHAAEMQREFAAIDHIPRNTRVLALVGLSCEPQWMLSRTIHVASLAVVRRHAFTNDQFTGDGQLITIRYRAAGAFIRDPSQMVVGENCPPTEWKPFRRALAEFPRDAFDMVWLIQPPVDRLEAYPGLAPVWSNGRSALYRIVRTAPPPATPRTASAPARSDGARARTAR